MLFFDNKNIIKAPFDGKIIPMKDVPDPAFSKGMLGEGIAIIPTSTSLMAPCQGFVSMIAPTKHALAITGEDGIEILIHIGLNTVELQGKGFDLLVKTGDIVSCETPLINIDSHLLNENAENYITSIVICNYRKFSITQLTNKKCVEASVHTLFKYNKL